MVESGKNVPKIGLFEPSKPPKIGEKAVQNCQKIQQKCPHAGAYAGGRRCAGGAGRCARALAGGCVRVRRGARHPLRYGGGIGQAAGFSRCRASGRRVLAGGAGIYPIWYGRAGHRGGAGGRGMWSRAAAGLASCRAGASGRRCRASGPPISQGTPSPGRMSILYGSKTAPGPGSSGRPVQVQQGGGAVASARCVAWSSGPRRSPRAAVNR